MLNKIYEQLIYGENVEMIGVKRFTNHIVIRYKICGNNILIDTKINTPFLYPPKQLNDMIHNCILLVLEIKIARTQEL